MKTVLKSHMRARQYEQALDLILRATPDLPYDDVQYASTALAKIPPELLAARVPLRKKLAILGGATTQFLTPLIRLFALRRGVRLEIYESEYGLFEQEVWSQSQAVKDFAPDVIHFHLSSHNAALGYHEPDHAARIQATSSRFLGLYKAARETFGCPVMADNFTTDCERPYGSLDAVLGGTRNNLLRAINKAISDALPAQTFVHDVELLSSKLGKLRYFDPRLYNSAKCAVSFECQPHYADSLGAALAAQFGCSKKCLVLDLDNTLWGGVIGDDGLNGIVLGAGQPAGEAFVEFQRYAKALKERGVLLAVVSKNELENALLPFREHADMVLRESDIRCFVANWDPKDGNVRRVAQQLNIGLDSLVFFDDNPAEREIVRANVPQVAVVDVPEDPSLFVHALDAAHWFDTLSVTDEDRKRSDFMRGNAAREQLESSTANYDEYLRQLEMKASHEPVSEANLARTTQLINKTNQFNLTTTRVTEAEVRGFASSANYYTATTRLADKFGDHGLISVVVGRIDSTDPEALHLDLWLMSCRVLKRGVEVFEMQQIVSFCRDRGIKRIHGRYLPTAKNKLVERHYADLGFKLVDKDGAATSWRYDVDEPLPLIHHIAIQR